MSKLGFCFNLEKVGLDYTKIFTFLCVLILCGVQTAKADSVHLGLRIHYKTAMSHVEKKDLPVIEMLRRISVVLPDAQFLIAGHTDTVGPYEMNVELSRGRANTVKLLMTYNGVPASKIETKWFSYDAPIASNDTEEGRSQNRRTVATVYGLTQNQAKQLVKAANKSKRFYVIKTESDKVVDYVSDVLEPDLAKPEKPVTEVKTDVEDDDVAKAESQAEKEDMVAVPDDVVVKDTYEDEMESELDTDVEESSEPEVDVKEELRLQKEQKKKDEAAEKARIKAEKDKKRKERANRPPSNKHRYSIGWALTDNQLVATRPGFEAIWVTDFNHSISLAYQYKIGKNHWLGASGAYGFQNYRVEDNPLYTWDEVTPNLVKAGINFDYEPAKKWALGFDVNYFEENFVISEILDIYLRKAAVFGVSGRGLYKFYDSESFSSRVKATLELPIAGSGPIEPSGGFGFTVGADVSWKKLSKNQEVNFGVFLGMRNFENIQNSQTESVAGFEIKIRNKLWK